jgi:hypothetical protein
MVQVQTIIKSADKVIASTGKTYYKVVDAEGHTYSLWDKKLFDLLEPNGEVILDVQQRGDFQTIVGVTPLKELSPSESEESRESKDKRICRLSCLESAIELAQAKISAGKDIESHEVVKVAKLFENYVYEKKSDKEG